MSKQNITFEINGEPGGTPANLPEINLSAQWGTREGQTEQEISTTSIDFVLEDAKRLNKHVDDGLSGGVGIFEGVPYKINLDNQNIFDGYIDLTNDAQFIERERVLANIVKTDGADWLNDVADGFSFGYLRENGFIVSSDFETIPYVLNYRPEAFIVGQLTIALFLLQKELVDGIRQIALESANLVALIPAFNAGGPIVDIGKIVAQSIRLVAQVVYTTAVVVALIQTVKDLINQFFPPVRRYLGMKEKRMFETGLNYLGLEFKSTIFDDPIWKNATFLPSKRKRGGLFGSTDEIGNPNLQSAVYNFGDFIRVMITKYNGDFKITDGVFQFERRDYWDNLSSYILPDVTTNQTTRTSELSYNTSEFVKNYFISFEYDIQDQNTLDDDDGRNYQVISNPIATNNEKLRIGKGLAQIRPPFALATKKTSLTDYEKVLLGVAKLTDKVVGFFGRSSNLAGEIRDRVGMMQLSADSTTVDKFLFINNEELLSQQPTAEMLWNSFHFIDSFAPVVDPITGETTHNQHVIRNAEKVPFCLEDWNKVIGNNKFTTESGQTGEIISIDWNFQQGFANIQYKTKQLYTKNIILEYNYGQ